MAADNYITKPTVTTYSQLHAAIYYGWSEIGSVWLLLCILGKLVVSDCCPSKLVVSDCCPSKLVVSDCCPNKLVVSDCCPSSIDLHTNCHH